MKKFTKPEAISILIIFIVLVGISLPNFKLSLRRARDQVRKDDMGVVQKALWFYIADFGVYPLASADGRIVACKNPDDKVKVDEKGRLVINFIPCQWGKDAIVDFTPGITKEYVHILPQDPDYSKGVSYHYFSDGKRFQLFVALEGKDEDEYNPVIVARGISCGNVACNAGRVSGCPVEKTIEQCAEEADRNSI
jgi:type II secretory pathway pseudopilin PulG